MRTSLKILNIAKSRLITFSAAILFNISLAAIVCGTFAYYTYATRTGLQKEYHGTTVGDIGSLQAGLISEVQIEDFLEYDLAEDDRTLAVEGKYIYWCLETISARTINHVLAANHYATTEMYPVTSGAFDSENEDPDSFKLYKSPSYLVNYNKNDYSSRANTVNYSVIDFVFRYEDVNNIGQYLTGYNVFLSKFQIETSDEGYELYKSVRFFYDNGYEGHIVNPTSHNNGTDVVGGILDLDEDGYYDYLNYLSEEIVYGEYEHFELNSTKTLEDGHLSPEELDSFNANHKQGIYALNESTFVPKTVNYMGIDKLTSRARPITFTDPDYHNMGRFKMYLYFEGWDRHVINSEIGFGYNLDLSFSM